MTAPEVLRRYVDALNRRDLPAMLELLDPDVELITGRGPRRGHEAVKKWLGDPYAELDVERVIDRVHVVGPIVVASGRVRHVWRETGELADESKHVWLARVENERIVRIQVFDDEASAFSAAGLPAEDAG